MIASVSPTKTEETTMATNTNTDADVDAIKIGGTIKPPDVNDLVEELQLSVLNQELAANEGVQLKDFNTEDTLEGNIELFRYEG